MLLIQLIWIILGCFIDWIGILLLTAPIFVPVAEKLGFDPVWLGVLFCLNMQISYISPPFGPAAFYLKGVTPPDITLGQIFGSVVALPDHAGRRARARDRLSADRAVAAGPDEPVSIRFGGGAECVSRRRLVFAERERA